MKIEAFPGKLTKQMVDRPFITKTGKTGCQRVMAWVLTAEQKAWLCKWFPEEENSRLMAASGLKWSALHRFAREFGLVKSAAGIKRIKKRQAAHIKRLCTQNGYYDSLRGRQPSEACRKAGLQMWQDIRDGKREHPFAVLRRTNPRKYRKWQERKSRERKEACRMERNRMVYMIGRKTKINVMVHPFSRRQVAHRYNALKRGYFVMEDCSEQSGERYNIYFDEDTQRAPLFEKNLVADGFKVKQWQNEN